MAPRITSAVMGSSCFKGRDDNTRPDGARSGWGVVRRHHPPIPSRQVASGGSAASRISRSRPATAAGLRYTSVHITGYNMKTIAITIDEPTLGRARQRTARAVAGGSGKGGGSGKAGRGSRSLSAFVREALRAKLDQMERDENEQRDRKSTRLNSSHIQKSRMPSSA